MKKTMLALSGAVIILAGCQDEKPVETTTVEATQVEEAQVATTETTDAMPIPEEQAEESQGISPETFVDNEPDTNSEHNANNAIDWSGTYQGTLPCADCPGIDTRISLNSDGTYVLEQNYQEKEDGQFTSQGSFNWNESGNTITLSNQDEPNQYLVGENMLAKLDTKGEKVSGDLAEQYHLIKQQ